MKKTYILLLAAACIALCGCKKETADLNKYTDAILYNVYGDVDIVAAYVFPLEKGQINELEYLCRCTYDSGHVTCDDNYAFFSEPEEWITEMIGEVEIPVVERDEKGRITRIYTIEDDDTLAHTYIYNKQGQLELHRYIDNNDGDTQMHRYTYDDHGWIATMVQEVSYNNDLIIDSVVYAVTESDEHGNWTIREGQHFREETEFSEDHRKSTTESRQYTTREMRFFCYTGEEHTCSVFNSPDAEDEETTQTDSLIGIFGKDPLHTQCNIYVYQPLEANGADLDGIKRLLIEAAIPGEKVKGSTLKDRAISAWGPAEKKLPVIDEVKWVADPSYMSISVIMRHVSAFSGNPRILGIYIDNYGSYSPTGDMSNTDADYLIYDAKTLRPILLKDMINPKRVDDFMSKLQGWYGDEINFEQICHAPMTINWPTITFHEPFIELYIPEFVGYMTEYGKEVSWYPSATMEMPMFD